MIGQINEITRGKGGGKESDETVVDDIDDG